MEDRFALEKQKLVPETNPTQTNEDWRFPLPKISTSTSTSNLFFIIIQVQNHMELIRQAIEACQAIASVAKFLPPSPLLMDLGLQPKMITYPPRASLAITDGLENACPACVWDHCAILYKRLQQAQQQKEQAALEPTF